MAQSEANCQLTGKQGKYVKSHLYPQALTSKLASSNDRNTTAFVQIQLNKRPARNRTGWYDNELVIEEGESILSQLDDDAIRELRQNHLVWSSWGDERVIPRLPVKESRFVQNETKRIRLVESATIIKLRLFFLSMMWRWCASTKDFAREVCLGDEELEHLRKMVTGDFPDNYSDFPIVITQYGTRGPVFFRSRFLEKRPNVLPKCSLMSEHIKFELDGLVACISPFRNDIEATKKFGRSILGADSITEIGVIDWEKSRSYEECNLAKYEAKIKLGSRT